MLQETIKKIEDAGVDIEIRLFPAGQLGNGEQVFGDVAQGVIDVGHTFIYSHNDPVLEINSLPYLVGTYEEMREVYSPGSNFYRIYEASLANQGSETARRLRRRVHRRQGPERPGLERRSRPAHRAGNWDSGPPR